MCFWLCVNDDQEAECWRLYDDSKKETVDRCFNMVHGLAPMKENVFIYVIEDIISAMYFGVDHYLCVAYEPLREDGLSAIQVSRPQINGGYNVEIVMNADNERGFICYCRKDESLEKTLYWFHRVLVEYDCPDLTSWMDITNVIRVYETDA